ncbi:MAG: DUF4082 domain-containing protein [Propioniciclava sp.]|uniref:DUF4082 domain-containing protein n=1 Tax=Propioniciclava sp. TaxID=2038686 RepID=UPI0039E23F10
MPSASRSRSQNATTSGTTATLWDANGTRLAQTRLSGNGGLVQANFATGVPLQTGRTYTVSYTAPKGQYPADELAFTRPTTSGVFNIPQDAGVYTYEQGSVPTNTYRSSNYHVDLLVSDTPGTTTPAPTAPRPSTPAKPTMTPSRTADPAPEKPQSKPTVPNNDATAAGLNLPRVPWEGGPNYWAQFSDASEWTDPSFFPIGIWHESISSDAEVQWDKSQGINYYAGLWEGTDFGLFERNDMYWLGSKLNSTFKDHSPNWPGVFLDDEVDGRFSPNEGTSMIQNMHNEWKGSGKFTYANYTQLVTGIDIDVKAQEKYVNTPDVSSVDMYWYSLYNCDWSQFRGHLYADPVSKETCRTSSSYGKTTNALTIRDAADGRIQPRWMFIENLNGLSTADQHRPYITPGQVKGAAMNSVINEARGLIYFNQSYTGNCQTAGALRSAQRQGSSFCGYPQIKAMGEVNNLIHKLARVINTQSYVWTFGSGLDTMLKTYGGDAYIFAMTDGKTGSRTFTLPPGVKGTSVEVYGEGRTLKVTDGRFTDNFANEYDYHIYKVSLA